MKNRCFKIMILSLLFLVVGCKKHPLTYEYLMQNPTVLQKSMSHCEFSIVENAECETVKRAANDFASLLTDRERNPEQFGEKILQAQQQVFLDKREAESDNLKILIAVVAMTGVE